MDGQEGGHGLISLINYGKNEGLQTRSSATSENATCRRFYYTPTEEFNKGQFRQCTTEPS